MSPDLLSARLDALAKVHGLALDRIEALETDLRLLRASFDGFVCSVKIRASDMHGDKCHCIFCAARRVGERAEA